MSSRLIEWLLSSAVVQAVLTIGLTAAVVWGWYSGRNVPDQLWTLLGLAWGFYFGGKATAVLMGQLTKR